MTSPQIANSWFLTGPTAAGKSAVGVELARRIGAEIISMDSMALYRGMDIGTAKPTHQQRESIPHHLIDVIEPCDEFSLAQYLEAAGREAAAIAGRGRQVLFVGGTPLYLKGLLRGIFQGPPADWPLRRRLALEAQRHGPSWLHDRLTEVDPAAAARLHPNDARRLVRALEVFEKTGRPISQLQRQFDVGRSAQQCRAFVLDWPRAELHARIDRRVCEMFAAGLVDEVRRLLARSPLSQKETGDESGPLSQIETGDESGPLSLWERARVRAGDEQDALASESESRSPHPQPLSQRERGDSPSPLAQRETGETPRPPLSRTARQAVGYREVIEHIAGRRGLAETIELVQLHTRQLAKRQMTWFRSISECRSVSVTGAVDADTVAGRIALLAEGR